MKILTTISLCLCLTATPALAQSERDKALAQMRGYPSSRTQGIATLSGLAQKGDVDAARALGAYYESGLDGAPDPAQALAWYRISAEAGNATDEGYVCAALAKGRGAAQDWNAALPWCRKAADANVAGGMAWLGASDVYGYGGQAVDTARGLDLINQSVALGSADGMNLLSRIDFDGQVAAQDYVASRKLAQRAMVLGSTDSLPWLALIYEQGLGIPAEPLEGARLHAYSADAGQAEGQAWMAQHPEVTEEALKANNLSILLVPGGPYTTTQTLPDGTIAPVDTAQSFFQGFNGFYPERALEDEFEGTTRADCHWNSDGNLDNCILLDEVPSGYNFGRASLKAMSRPIKVDQQDAWKAAVAGHSFNVTVRWTLG